MFWNRIHNASLKYRLLAILTPLMAVFTIANVLITEFDAGQSINAAYDRSLLGVIKSIDQNVSTASGGLSVELPYQLFELFQLTASGEVYFKVSTTDGLVEIGNHDLPDAPEKLAPGRAVFYDAKYFGQAVRVGAYLREGADPSAAPVYRQSWVIQVAETTRSRDAFSAALIKRTVWRDGLLVVVIAGTLALGLMLALRPLLRLAFQISQRDADDLSPLPTANLPSELLPLVFAVNAQLRRTEALMAERRAFLDDASHQLRTPLAVMKTQVDFALRQSDERRRGEAIAALAEEVVVAIRGTNQLLALAHSDSAAMQRRTLDLKELLTSVAVDLLPLARRRGIDLGVELPDGGMQISGDRDLLTQALSNIVHNAIEHGRESGVVTISGEASDRQHVVAVVDDGQGIPDDIMARIGTRFAKGKSSRGSGLGIAIAKSVMHRHGGELLVARRVGTPGMCVKLTWPSC